jgi:Tfp pilus assembly protein PilZ
MDEMKIKDKRKYARIPIKSRVIVCMLEGQNETFHAVGKNVGAEGIQFVCERKMSLGDILMLDIDLPQAEDTFQIKSEVKWCNPVAHVGSSPIFYDTGVQFMEIDKEYLKLLINCICGDLSGELLNEMG